MRFHVVSLPHTQTTLEYSACAFTEKVRKFCIMMHNLGHEVFLYSGDRNEAPCTEHVQCFTEGERLAHCDGKHFIAASWNPVDAGWVVFNTRVVEAIRARAQEKDFICLISGWAGKPVADMFPQHQVVEFGIGYPGSFAKYRVFESYAWMHAIYGAETRGNAGVADGRWFDAIIPGYFETERFEFSAEKDDYYFFIGRLIDRKGPQIAAEVCKRLGKRLIVAGQGTPPEGCEYVGVIGPEERNRLMSRARAVFVPTVYLEPFGNVAVEAQACGTPAITTDWGAFTETVLHGQTGFRCRTLREFIDAALTCHTLDPWAIRQHAVANYSLEATAVKYDRYFRRLLTVWGDGWYDTTGLEDMLPVDLPSLTEQETPRACAAE
jgi:glycosyltransferase involved in cell wall biosynthesis